MVRQIAKAKQEQIEKLDWTENAIVSPLHGLTAINYIPGLINITDSMNQGDDEFSPGKSTVTSLTTQTQLHESGHLTELINTYYNPIQFISFDVLVGGGLEMSSLAFSIGIVNPRKFRIPNKRLIKISDSKEASNIRLSSQYPQKSSLPIVQKNVNPTLPSRREVLGFSFFFGFLDVLLQSEESVAAEAAPCELTVAPSGLAFCDKVVGTGPEAAKGQLIKAHYVGKLENGKVFDSSYNRGKPLTFRVGVGEVIKGWDQGILGGDGIPPMLAGGKRILKLPPELGYGVRGAGCKGGSCIIPPDSVLLFDVEFVGKA
ncbi:hypothetical protein CMV_024473 [Castanea mollissima]|uniref:peptidylprolyl isomerase n=2 Tax=Castanea TaxID=21019 RepID=A0A8J4VHY5_9ROSI|nr:hypothetical protein CMV_024473 [Castanea mollissima]